MESNHFAQSDFIKGIHCIQIQGDSIKIYILKAERMEYGGKCLMVGFHGDSDHLLYEGILAPVSKGIQNDPSSITNPKLELEVGPAGCNRLLDQLPQWSVLGIPETTT